MVASLLAVTLFVGNGMLFPRDQILLEIPTGSSNPRIEVFGDAGDRIAAVSGSWEVEGSESINNLNLYSYDCVEAERSCVESGVVFWHWDGRGKLSVTSDIKRREILSWDDDAIVVDTTNYLSRCTTAELTVNVAAGEVAELTRRIAGRVCALPDANSAGFPQYATLVSARDFSERWNRQRRR